MNTEATEKKQPIQGWLILIGIVVWGTPFIVISSIIMSATPPVEPALLVYSIISFIFGVTSVFLFHMRKKAFVTLYLLYQYFLVVENCYFWIRDIYMQHAVGRVFLLMIPAAVELVLIIGYLIKSKRVKYTFVR